MSGQKKLKISLYNRGSVKTNELYLQSIVNVSPEILSICFSGDKLSCITTTNTFSSFSIDTLFSPNLYVHQDLITLFPISNT